ncbi:MAG: glycosyltransferase [Candidatus Omnitrophica bacterium]|nr:glycosyltransferase [Candidatus Omnitrophota bacterium]
MSISNKVSVIVPTKNSERTLAACLLSIRNQTHQPVEIVVVDRASGDNTVSIAKQFADIIATKEPERSAQRNEGVRLAHGEFIAIIDSDMYLTPEVIAACVSALKNDPTAAGVTIPEKSIGNGFWASCKQLERSFYVGIPWMEGARFFCRADFIALGGYDETLVSGEDWDLSQRFEKMGKILRVNEFILHDEGELKLSKILQKKWYYAIKFAKYTAKKEHTIKTTKQISFIRRFALFLSAPKKLFRRPLVGVGMLFMKTCEFATGGLGYCIGILKRD